MVNRRVRGFVVALVVLLNVAGGPMAFAHGTAESVQGSTVSEHCADHAQASLPDAPPAPADDGAGDNCCAGGHCVCVAASIFHAMSATVLVQFARYVAANPLRLSEPRSAVPSDPLRPPIV